MDEYFERDGAFAFDGADIVEGQLPGQDGAGHSFCGQQTGGGSVVDRHLSAGMNSQSRHGSAQGVQQADILHDDRVHAHAVELGRVEQKSPQLAVAYQSVGSNVDLDPVKMGQPYGFFQLIHCEIVGESSGGKAFSAQIDRVCPVGDSGLQRGEAAGRGQ